MLVSRFTVGPVSTNCYIVADEATRETMVIDPDLRDGLEVEKVLTEIREKNLNVVYIVNTHGHSDHIGGNAALKKATGASILVHADDAALLPEPWKRIAESSPGPRCFVCGHEDPQIRIAHDLGSATIRCMACGFSFEFIASPVPDRLLHDGDMIDIGEIGFRVMHMPGHSPGQICLYSEPRRVLFTGDVLFQGSIGRTDLPGSSEQHMARSLHKLAGLPDDVAVYPGHGEPTTIGAEKRFNPYLRMAITPGS